MITFACHKKYHLGSAWLELLINFWSFKKGIDHVVC